jgi:hypothetical protein
MESYRMLLSEAQEKLRHFATDEGEITMPMDAFIITAGRS